jgi:hypothetical protein
VAAREVSYNPTPPYTARNVQNAFDQLIAAGPLKPPAVIATPVTFAMSPYTALVSDYLLEVDTSGGAVTIILPLSASRQRLPLEVKDATGNASTNNISVTRTAPETIDGLTTYLIASDFDAKTFKPNFAATSYEVI